MHGPHQDRARSAQQVSATPKRVVSIGIGRSAPQLPLALEVPPNPPARAGEVIEIELSCAVHESGARASWTGGVMSLTQRCREPSSNEEPGRFSSRCNELERLGQQFGNEALYSAWKSSKFLCALNANSENSQPFRLLRSLQNFLLSECRSSRLPTGGKRAQVALVPADRRAMADQIEQAGIMLALEARERANVWDLSPEALSRSALRQRLARTARRPRRRQQALPVGRRRQRPGPTRTSRRPRLRYVRADPQLPLQGSLRSESAGKALHLLPLSR